MIDLFHSLGGQRVHILLVDVSYQICGNDDGGDDDDDSVSSLI
jgi:hypothetical protein